MSNFGVADWQALVDLERLMRWMDQHDLGDGPVENVRQLTGGTQNLLLRFDRAGGGYVLRRPPLHPRMDGNGIMRREIRVLSALADTDVPHPQLIAGCTDPEVLGSAFYLMEPVDGFNATAAMPAQHADDPGIRHGMGLAMADGAAALGRIDLTAVGLADFGKLDGFLQRQAPRWWTQLESYRDYAGWSGPDGMGDVRGVARWLEQACPASFEPGLMHGDYHLANVMFRNDGPGLAAIVDWELSTAGDPLVDLGWLLATWPNADGSSVGPPAPRPWQGFATPGELVAQYARGSQRDLSDLDWYAVLACYKLGIILEGTYARACAGKAPMATGEQLHAAAQGLFARAQRWIEAGGLPVA
ncbi:phosphotransferase family protein [Cupriavidus necator]